MGPSVQEMESRASSDHPGNIWFGLHTEPINKKSGMDQHSNHKFCPFELTDINDRASHDISSRELVEKCILPRDEEAIGRLADEEVYRRACIAEATVNALTPL